MKQRFFKKIAEEYASYEAKVLQYTKKDIYRKSYQIEIMINVFTILTELAEELSDCILESLICKPNLLQTLYESWMNTEDRFYDEILECVKCELNNINLSKNTKEGNANE